LLTSYPTKRKFKQYCLQITYLISHQYLCLPPLSYPSTFSQ
jgi:hypothetical protein